MIVRPLIFTVAVAVATAATAAQDLLPPEKAYRVESRQVGQGVVEFDYQIAPGYILYKERFSAELLGAPGRLELDLPPAQTKFDHVTNHQVDFYRDRVTVRVKLPGGQDKPAAGVVATAQGCAVEAGVCYPPLRTTWTAPSALDVDALMSARRSGSRGCQGKTARNSANEMTHVVPGSC